MDLGEIIKHAIMQKGITQKDLADHMETNRTSVSEWCQNRKTQKWNELIKLAEYLKIEKDIFGEKTQKASETKKHVIELETKLIRLEHRITEEEDKRKEASSKIQVAIIEDDYSNYLRIQYALQFLGCPGLHVHYSNCREALENIKKTELKISLIILDLQMGKNDISGIEFLNAMADEKNWVKFPVLIYSAYDDLMEKAALFSGIFGFLRKPLDFDVLQQSLKQIDLYWPLKE